MEVSYNILHVVSAFFLVNHSAFGREHNANAASLPFCVILAYIGI